MAKPNFLNSIKLTKPNKNNFDLSHDVKLSLDMGQLVPICIMEAVPGDSFNISCESLLRFAPLVSPVMHRMDCSMHYFFVPNRITWPDWPKWIVRDETTPLTMPYIEYTDPIAVKTLEDYLGLPITSALSNLQVNALPFAAYQAVYNEYYRDQNLITEVNYKLTSGDNTANDDLRILRKRAWEHDYFTASLPFAQKGEAVKMPFGTQEVFVNRPPDAPGDGTLLTGTPESVPVHYKETDDLGSDTMYTDGSNTDSAPNINDLRRAEKLQQWLEKNARAGTRYVENILAHFGVKSSDARLQRPEYITGTKSPVVISEILNTTGEDAGLPQGNMAGHGISVTSGKYGNYFCEEHGYIIGIMSVMPKTAYQQGVPRHFLKRDQFDYFWPDFAHLGEQAVYKEEIYADTSDPGGTFGYLPRYAEYKNVHSRVAGDFKDSLDFWHFGRIFDTEPALNQEFIECDPGKRIFAVETSVNSLYAHVLNKVSSNRPMPKFGTPYL